MSDYTQITKRLRLYLYDAMVEIPSCLKRAFSFCDSIDAAHKTLEDEFAEMQEFCDRLKDAVNKREDLTMWSVDYTAMPLDADGVPIHVGDVMEGEKVGGGFCEPFEVVGYIMSNGELEPMDEHKCPRRHKYLHHHHEPTVADILRQFADEIITFCTSVEDHECVDAIEEFSKRLRLAEEE